MQTLARGLAVLEALCANENGLSLHELSQRLKCPKPSLLRLLDTLQDRHYLVFDKAAGRYALDPMQLLRATNLYRPSGGRSVAIRRLLEHVTQRTGETTLLAVLDPRSGMAASVDHIEPPHIVRAVPSTYRPLPALRTCLGRAWLARSSDAEAREVAHRWVEAAGDPTEEVARVLADLDTIRAQGYAVTVDGLETGLAVIAAVVTDGDDQPFGGMVVLAPAFRTPPERIAAIGRAVRDGAQLLSNLFAHDLTAVDPADERELVGARREP